MTKTKKPAYSLARNSAFMFSAAWEVCPQVIFLALFLAAAAALKAGAELFIAPVILKNIETAAPLSRLMASIAWFSFALLVLTGLEAYIRQNALFGRIAVRQKILTRIIDKVTGTSYPNTLDTDFLNLESKACKACSDNFSPTEAFWTSLTELLTNLFGFAAWSFLLCRLSPLLMCLIAAASGTGYMISRRVNRWTWHHREEESSCLKPMDYIRSVFTDRHYAKDIRIFCLQPWLLQVWNTALDRYCSFLFRRERFLSLSDHAGLLLNFLRSGAAFYVLIRLTLTRGLPASDFLLYTTAAGGFARWVTGIMDSFSRLSVQSLELSVIREFLEWPEPFRFEDGVPLSPASNTRWEIRLDDVSFSYAGSRRAILSHVNLTLSPGEKLAVVGLNGAGKTTLVKLICGLLDPTEGTVFLNGRDIRQYNRRDYYRLFSAVFQDFSLLEASAAENVVQAVDHIDEERVLQCLSMAGLTEKITSLPHGIHTNIGRQVYEDGVELSGGQTQRLMLARALYKNGPVMILDEPTAALDPIAEHEIYMAYSRLTRGRTALFISHRLASTRFCDRIILLEQGWITEEGTHEQLLERNGTYAGLFRIQSRYYQEKGDSHEPE